MKTFKIRYILMAIIAVAISSCAEEDLVIFNDTAAVVPTASDSEVVLTKEMEGTDALTISWAEPDYGFTASPTYYIYLDAEGGDFSEGIAINNGGELSKALKAEELNRHLLALGFEPEVAGNLQVKVESRLSPSKSVMSEVITVNVTPYSAFLDLSTNWGIVGSGYNNWGAFPDAPFFTSKNANELVSYVELIDGYIKFRENNDWANNLGDNGADGSLEAGGSDIAVTAGRYKITWNTQTNAYSIAPFSWGIVGSAYNDWGGGGPDFPFYYDDATDQWRAIVKLLDGEFKIRKNNDWGLNYGDSGADGTLEEGGDNMVVTAGKYEITFNENDLTIEIVPIDAIWGLVGSAYNDWGGGGPDAQFIKDYRNEGTWILRNVSLLDGEFKIRDDNSWGTNYGDTGLDGTLDLGGDNIPSTAGIYTITLNFADPANPTWTSIKY